MRGSKSARTVSRPPARCVGRTQMWRSDIPSTTVTPSGPQRSLPRMGAFSLRAQEPQLMRSPGEPLQLNQRSFGCMIELAVIGHRPRARSSSDASRGSVEITVLPGRRGVSCLRSLISSAPLRHLLLCGPHCGFARVQDWTLSNRVLTADIRVSARTCQAAQRPWRSFQAASPSLGCRRSLKCVSSCSQSAAGGKRAFPIAYGRPGAGIRLSCRRFVASCSALDRPPRDEAADPPERQAACFWRKLL